MPLFNHNVWAPIASGDGGFSFIGVIITVWVVLGALNFLGRKLTKQAQPQSVPDGATPAPEEPVKSELQEFLDTIRKQAEIQSAPPPPAEEIQEFAVDEPVVKIAVKRSAALPPPSPYIAPAPVAPSKDGGRRQRILADLHGPRAWQKAVIMREIFGQPLALRRQDFDAYQG